MSLIVEYEYEEVHPERYIAYISDGAGVETTEHLLSSRALLYDSKYMVLWQSPRVSDIMRLGSLAYLSYITMGSLKDLLEVYPEYDSVEPFIRDHFELFL